MVESSNALRSSLRDVDPEITLRRVQALADTLGIARVTDITRLDRFGIPVCVAVRPDAQRGSLCVTAGKGLRGIDARVGAMMEALEMAWAEYGRSKTQLVTASARLVGGADALISFAPRIGQRLALDAPLPCVVAEDLTTGERAFVPADLVFHPFRHPPGWFGTSTNGLASGNTLAEATLHALLELVERDALAFLHVGAPSRIVSEATLPPDLLARVEALRASDLDLVVRHVPSVVGLPVISVMASDRADRMLAMRGDGCHLVPEIALVRALTEAMQSRLSYIHGGRDDLIDIWRTGERGETIGRTEIRTFAAGEVMAFDELPRATMSSVTAALDDVRARLAAAGFARVLRVVFTPPQYPVQVVRLIVPRLECYTGARSRVGPRLREYTRRQ